MTNRWTLARILPQTGRRFFITGANSGVGYWAAVELARSGATVVLACRDRARGEDALRRLRTDAATPQSAAAGSQSVAAGSQSVAAGSQSAAAQAELVVLDLASLESVREVAEAELARKQPLHGLINNAGVMRPAKRRETADGFELQFGTNVLGHFALTCRLMPALEMARSAHVEDAPRIVTLSSIAHKRGRIDFDDLQATRSYNPLRSYEQSKLADLMFAFELERRLRAGSFGAVSIAVHPGVANSRIFRLGSSTGLSRLVEKTVMGTIGLLLNSTLEGAIPTIFAATAHEARGGAYYGPQGFQEMRGGDVGAAYVAPAARDAATQQRLWDICAQLTGCTI